MEYRGKEVPKEETPDGYCEDAGAIDGIMLGLLNRKKRTSDEVGMDCVIFGCSMRSGSGEFLDVEYDSGIFVPCLFLATTPISTEFDFIL